MMDDIFEFVMEYILAPFMCVMLVGFVFICIIGVFMIPSFIKHDKELERQIEECYMQKPRTKECELVLYKYENRRKHTTTVMPMPVVVK